MMPEYLLHLRAEPDAVEPAVRLRQLLKVGLRGFKLRAVSVEEVPTPPMNLVEQALEGPHVAPNRSNEPRLNSLIAARERDRFCPSNSSRNPAWNSNAGNGRNHGTL